MKWEYISGIGIAGISLLGYLTYIFKGNKKKENTKREINEQVF